MDELSDTEHTGGDEALLEVGGVWKRDRGQGSAGVQLSWVWSPTFTPLGCPDSGVSDQASPSTPSSFTAGEGWLFQPFQAEEEPSALTQLERIFFPESAPSFSAQLQPASCPPASQPSSRVCGMAAAHTSGGQTWVHISARVPTWCVILDKSLYLFGLKSGDHTPWVIVRYECYNPRGTSSVLLPHSLPHATLQSFSCLLPGWELCGIPSSWART